MKPPPRPPSVLLALSLCGALAGAALRAADDSQPTVITSDHLEARSTDTRTYSTFTGHVVVTGTNIHITCDELDVVSTRSGTRAETIGTQAQFEHLEAIGRVRIAQGDREASCGRAEVRPQDDQIILTEDPVVTDRSNGTHWTGDTITMLRNQRRVIVGHPRVTGPPIKDLGFDKHTPPPETPAGQAQAPAPAAPKG